MVGRGVTVNWMELMLSVINVLIFFMELTDRTYSCIPFIQNRTDGTLLYFLILKNWYNVY